MPRLALLTGVQLGLKQWAHLRELGWITLSMHMVYY